MPTQTQHTLNALPNWLKDWRLMGNVAKTYLISIRTVTLPQLKLMGQNVEWSATVNYIIATIALPHVNNVVA